MLDLKVTRLLLHEDLAAREASFPDMSPSRLVLG